MPTIRCLLVAHTFPPVLGGSSIVYDSLARCANGAIGVLTSRCDHRTGTVLPGWQTADAAAPFLVRRCALVRPPLAGRSLLRRVVQRIGWRWHATVLAGSVAALVWHDRFDAVCVCDDESVGWLIPFVRHVLGRVAAVYCHGDDLVQRDGRVVRQRARWLRHADVVFAASRFANDRLVVGYGLSPQRIVLLPNGVDAARFAPRPPPPALIARYGLAGRRVILAASRLVARKGFDRLIAAMPPILTRHPDVLCLIVGDGPERAALAAQAARAGVETSIRFAGEIAPAAMPDHYALAEIVVLPNRALPGEADGIPLVLLEANAAGKPVIGGQAGGTPEVVDDGRNGLLVDGDSPDAIAAAVCRLLDDAALRATLAAGGLAAARDAAWPARAQAFLMTLQHHAAARGPRPGVRPALRSPPR